MTFLPIVARELRVASRRGGTYVTRLGVALAAILVGVSVFVATVGVPAQQVGQYIFQGLAGLALVYSLAYGRRATADCLSEEKREGTLGLLFLTDLKGHDVVLGKLAATSLSGFYGLLAFFPVLAVPMLMGGITNGEFWRMVLLLADTFLLSLAIGMLGSALSRDYRRAMAANFLLLFLVIALPPAVAGGVAFFSPTNRFVGELFFTCPIFAFYFCSDRPYTSSPEYFWMPVAVMHALTWLLLGLASSVVPRSWQDQPTRSGRNRWREFWQAWSYGKAEHQREFRREALGANAFYWLAARARFKPRHVWAFLAAMLIWWVVGWLASGSVWLDDAVFLTTALLLNSTLKWWVAIEACQQLAEDRRTGTLELLLSTPLTVHDITRGQLLALRRQFLKPLLAVLGVELVFILYLYSRAHDLGLVVIWLGGMLMLLADVAALAWVAMWKAMTTRSAHRAVVGTVLRIIVLPWAVFGTVLGIANLWAWVAPPSQRATSWQPGIALWFGLGLAADLGFGLRAWQQLRLRFREFALQRFAPAESLRRRRFRRGGMVMAAAAPTSITVDPSAGATHAKPLRRPRRIFAVAATVFLLLVCAGSIAWRRLRPSFPPPILVSLSQSNAPLQAFPGAGGAFLVLPDDSLWSWGQPAGALYPRTAVPELVGTNRDWQQVMSTQGGCVGLQRDGTLWTWGWWNGLQIGDPQQVGSDRDWVSVAAAAGHGFALRRNGTLWAWGDNSRMQLGNGPGPNQKSPVQVGTNEDWVAVTCNWTGPTALRRDGTLWTWGQVYTWNGTSVATVKSVPYPTRVCRETNWTELHNGFGLSILAQNQAGEVWDPVLSPPNPDLPISALGRLVASNAGPGRFAVAYAKTPQMYQVRGDGTLWRRAYPFLPQSVTQLETWRRVGTRSDWVTLWGGGGSAIGLTADGTVWTWGADPSREPVLDFLARLKFMQSQVAAWLGGSRNVARYGGHPKYQQEPRPLMKFQFAPIPTAPSGTAEPR